MSEIIKNDLFEYSGYKNYLVSLLGQHGTRKGGRSRLASFLGCQTAFISQVLNKSANFSLEQAHKINEFLKHDPDETEAFLLLVLKERAGSFELAQYFEKKFFFLKEKRKNIKRRLRNTETISKEAETVYYSNWYYLAVHMLVSISQFQDIDSISGYLNLPKSKVKKALVFLEENGLIVFQNDRYQFGPRHIHLEEGSNNIFKHHTNWRLQAIQSLQYIGERDDLHYSVVYSLAKREVPKIREQFVKIIKENIKTIKDSEEEVMYCNTIDFFEVKS